jgi:BASS family bile acid:Na+ symporter
MLTGYWQAAAIHGSGAGPELHDRGPATYGPRPIEEEMQVLTRLRALAADGPVILTLGVVIGLAVPPLADAIRPLLTACVFIFVAGTFLRLDGASVLAALKNPRFGIALPVIAVFLTPLAVAQGIAAVGWTGPLAAALVLSLAAPPSSANAAIARMLGATGSIAFVVTTVATFAVPVSAPLVMMLSGPGQANLSAFDLAVRLFLLLGAAGGLTLVLRRFAPRFVEENAGTFDRIVVAALFVFALATMSGVPRLFWADPATVLLTVAVAYAANVILALIFALASPGGLAERTEIGLTMGNRNVGLIWAALGSGIDPFVALYFAAAQFPIFTTPLLIRLLRRPNPA